MPRIDLTPRVALIPGGVNIGVLRGDDGQIVLIDTGLNETSGKRVLKTIREEIGGDAKVVAILTTHAHADHFGANAIVVKRTGARVYAPAVDEAVLRYPLLQPISLFAGADPIDTLRGGFLLADASPVDEIVHPGPLVVAGIPIEVIPLAGHSMNQVGFLVDRVFFCADVVLPASVLDKYKIPYLFSVSDHLQALATAAAVPCQVAVPGHGPHVADLSELIALNRGLIDAVLAKTLVLATTPVTAEALLTALLTHFGAAVTDAAAFYLLQPTVFAVLSHLHRQGHLVHRVHGAQSWWVAVGGSPNATAVPDAATEGPA